MNKIVYEGLTPEKFHEFVGALYIELGFLDQQREMVKANFDRFAGAPRYALENGEDPTKIALLWLRTFRESAFSMSIRLNRMCNALPTDHEVFSFSTDEEDDDEQP